MREVVFEILKLFPWVALCFWVKRVHDIIMIYSDAFEYLIENQEHIPVLIERVNQMQVSMDKLEKERTGETDD